MAQVHNERLKQRRSKLLQWRLRQLLQRWIKNVMKFLQELLDNNIPIDTDNIIEYLMKEEVRVADLDSRDYIEKLNRRLDCLRGEEYESFDEPKYTLRDHFPVFFGVLVELGITTF